MQFQPIHDKRVDTKYLILLMLVAYAFSFLIRMIWVWQFQDNPSFYWNDQIMINTNDGYFFAAGAQQALFDMHQHNPRIPDIYSYGMVFLTTWLVKLTPFSLETITLYLPAVISGLVVIPIILIARLYGEALWGFFAALLGSIALSYYNRTMIGYYDTDMFSAMAPMFILYFLMKSTIDFNLRSALYAAIAISIYPFLYDQGASIIYAMGIIYALYLIWYHREEKLTYISLLLVFLAMIPFGLPKPYEYIAHIVLVVVVYGVLSKISVSQKYLIGASVAAFIALLFFGNVFGIILGKMMSYMATGTKAEGLHFYGVHQTVREAGKIPFDIFADRISGSVPGLIAAMLGYILLAVRHRAFFLALPLMGIGIFALWGGLRFTVYAVPVAAMGAIYFFYMLGSYFKDKKAQYALVLAATAALLYPNIKHIIGYKVPTVMTKDEVQDLKTLKTIAKPEDYTLTWWDYGYPIWYYSETSTLIDGGKHQNDNFIISKILQTTSPELAANLSRLAVETYVNSGYKIVADTLFKNEQKDQTDPNLMLSELELSSYKLPPKTRDIYLYLPYRMLRIFPTVVQFGNLDLTTGKPLRELMFYPLSLDSQKDGMLKFSNGIVMDAKKGELYLGKQKGDVRFFILTDNLKNGEVNVKAQQFHPEGKYVVIYMQSYGQFVLMDTETFLSTYVQMFILGKYNPDLFELVVSTPYSKIYRLKK
ncbi:peptide-binding protein [Sulfurovum sp. zt1-1]|uniref:Peptide-binding protein n=1 Tax=Sulfurovum zhangzhouensis TaxID=3019067 RepID=A0ABT7R005_9BACT|nr:STT3 domain-containing protein [Sulfurovum zhangzhouensis]MDM5272398.1 peptide-binding protein [Sulfurovum zhangzhouensis]